MLVILAMYHFLMKDDKMEPESAIHVHGVCIKKIVSLCGGGTAGEGIKMKMALLFPYTYAKYTASKNSVGPHLARMPGMQIFCWL